MSTLHLHHPVTDDSAAERIRAFYENLSRDIAGAEPADVIVDRYHTEDIVQVSDGLTIDRKKLVDHIPPLRKQRFDLVGVEVHEALAADGPEGSTVAARLTLRGRLRRGPVVTDLHLFGHFTPDGRMRRAHLLTRDPDTGRGPA